MVPDAWLPTCTVVTAWSVPVAVTVLRKEPRSTRAVRYSAALARPPQNQNPAAAASATAAATNASRLFLFRNDFIRSICFPLWAPLPGASMIPTKKGVEPAHTARHRRPRFGYSPWGTSGGCNRAARRGVLPVGRLSRGNEFKVD